MEAEEMAAVDSGQWLGHCKSYAWETIQRGSKWPLEGEEGQLEQA